MKQKVKLGLYGCGNRTCALLDSLEGENEYAVEAAYDLREESVAKATGKYGGAACRSAAELIASKQVDAFIISLDPFAHPDAFLATLEAGKPIFIEKPIAPTAEVAHRMMRAAQEARVPVQVGFAHRYTASVRALRQYLRENDPGRIFSITYNWHQKVETEIINMHNMFPGNFRLKISQIPFHCCHALDVMCLLVGDVRSVYAYGLKHMPWEYVTPDEVIALFEFAGGAIGHFHYSGVTYGSNGFPGVIHAENYTVVYTPWGEFDVWRRPKYANERGEGLKEDCRPTYDRHVGPDKFCFGYNRYDPIIMTDFFNSVRNGSPMPAPIEDGYRTAEIATAIEMSCQSRRKIELPLQFA